MWRLHVEVATALADALLPATAARGAGRMILIGSRASQGMPGRSRYAASKVALVVLVRSWAAELSAMKIGKILESTRPIKSDIRNAFIDFSKMTLSLVAVFTDVIRGGVPVIGYGFSSNGRLLKAYGGFPDGVRVKDGYVDLPPLSGIGFEGKADLIAAMRDLAR